MAPPGATVQAALCRVMQAPAAVSLVSVIWRGGADLPSMVDTLPTFDETYGAEGNAEGGAQEGGAPDGDERESGAGGNNGSGSSGQSGVADSGDAAGPGTRASGGMESDVGTGGPMTAAERVAILDRQLEESTRDFDGIIYDEEQRQREAARDRAAQTAQTGGRRLGAKRCRGTHFWWRNGQRRWWLSGRRYRWPQ